jgi:hypothetical protein
MTLQMVRPTISEPKRRISRVIAAVVLAGVGVFGVGMVYHHETGGQPLTVHGVQAR